MLVNRQVKCIENPCLVIFLEEAYLIYKTGAQKHVDSVETRTLGEIWRPLQVHPALNFVYVFWFLNRCHDREQRNQTMFLNFG